MVWFNVDDGFYDHPKVKSIPRGAPRKGAVCLWTLAGNWNAKYFHDGLIPIGQVDELGGTAKDVAALTTSGLWHPPGYQCTDEKHCSPVPPGYVGFHQWEIFQQTKAQVEAKRAAARERKSRSRSRRDTTTTNEGTTPNVTRQVTP